MPAPTHVHLNSATEKRQRLREGLDAADPFVLVGAHDALSAKLIEQYGFDGVWVSGFGVSTMAYGLPDLNLVGMAEALQAAVRVDAATTLPVVADCDNGFGAALNFIRTIQAYEQAGISGVSVEDNLFPKRNSLLEGGHRRPLLAAEEQAARIRAGKEAQSTEEFVLIARVEALIAGHGIGSALDRAHAYAEAGADAVLIHSKDKTLEEIREFLVGWEGDVPLVAVPTRFPDYTDVELANLGFGTVILANHPMRAAILGMEQCLETLSRERKAAAVDPNIASVKHVFELVGTERSIWLEDQISAATSGSDTSGQA